MAIVVDLPGRTPHLLPGANPFLRDASALTDREKVAPTFGARVRARARPGRAAPWSRRDRPALPAARARPRGPAGSPPDPRSDGGRAPASATRHRTRARASPPARARESPRPGRARAGVPKRSRTPAPDRA